MILRNVVFFLSGATERTERRFLRCEFPAVISFVHNRIRSESSIPADYTHKQAKTLYFLSR